MDIKTFYKESILNKLLVINIAVYLGLAAIRLLMYLMQYDAVFDIFSNSYLALPAEPKRLLLKFWTPITYMFVHFDFWHIFSNMLWLYFMGRIFTQCFNNRQTLGLYLMGGLGGALLFVLFYNVFPIFHAHRAVSTCVGASAAISAIVIALCASRPNFEIRIFGIFPLTLKWLGILYVVFDVFQIRGDNAGGHIAHIGGAIVGLLFALGIRKGKDITSWINSIIDWIVSVWPFGKSKTGHKTKMRVSYINTEYTEHADDSASKMSDGDFNQQKAADQQRIDEILDKISKTGYNNLTKEEKEFLFKMSKR